MESTNVIVKNQKVGIKLNPATSAARDEIDPLGVVIPFVDFTGAVRDYGTQLERLVGLLRRARFSDERKVIQTLLDAAVTDLRLETMDCEVRSTAAYEAMQARLSKN